jgi:hypothetical protein
MAAMPVAAMRLRFNVRYGGAKVEGGEICVYQSPGLGSDDPVPKYFASNDVRCLPADKILAFPEGKWSYVTRVGERYVSYGGSMDVVGGQAEAGYREFVAEVHDAVSVDLSSVVSTLAPDEFVVIYFPSTRARLATSAPLPRGSATIQIPNSVPWLPVVSDGKTLRRVGRLHAGSSKPERIDAAELSADPGSIDVVTWFRWQRGDHDYVANNPAPDIVLFDGTIEHQPLAGAGSAYSDGLVIFKKIPRKPAELHIAGELWESRNVPIALPVTSSSVLVVQALPANPAGAVAVALSIDSALLRLQPKARTCDRVTLATDARLTIELARCEQLILDMTPGELQQLGGCETVVHRDLQAEELATPAVLGGLPAGVYRLGARHAALPTKFTSVQVATGRRTEAPFDLRYANIYGHITRGGEPVAAHVVFSGGDAASDADTGAYAAVLTASPERRLVTVTSCGGSWRYTFVPDTPVVAGSTFDVNVPRNRVEALVLDAATGQPIAGAKVSATANAGSDQQPLVVRATGTATGAAGDTTLESLLPNRNQKLCARHDDYAERCEELDTLADDETRSVTLRLNRIEKRDGRIVSSFSMKQLVLMWVDPSGRVTEMDNVRDDGSFRYGTAHSVAEQVVLVSATHPLAVIHPAPATDEQPLTITVPNGPLRTVQVRLTPEAASPNALIALRFGALPIPFAAFSRHQVMRGLDQEVRSSGPLVIPDLLGTEPIFVMRGPDPEQLPRDLLTAGGAMEAACARPEYRPLCTVLPVGGDGVVTFP